MAKEELMAPVVLGRKKKNRGHFLSHKEMRKKLSNRSPLVDKITGLAKSGLDDKTLLWEGLSRKYKL